MTVSFLQVGAALPSSPLELVGASTAATKFVLAALVVLSVGSWMIMLAKWNEFRKARSASAEFGRRFHHAKTVDEAASAAELAPDSPHTAILGRAVTFLEETTPAISATGERRARLSQSQVEALRMVLDSEVGVVRERMSRFVPWLATIGSVSPLIGLLGTVLGVIDAFLGIATQGSGNIGAVAPGIAEALIATAAALAVAIPAVFGYNIFANRLNTLDNELETFGAEIIALLAYEGRI